MRDKEFQKRYYLKNLLETKRKVKESIGNDNLISQCISNIEDLDRASNLLVKRLREWYELENPEFSAKVPDHENFIMLLIEKKDRKEALSMGADLKKQDSLQIRKLGKEIHSLYTLRKDHEKYLERLMKETCPNIQAVAGTMVGAKLLSHAGTLKRLSIMTASTIQLLGAEKALFRHMKTGARAPKHGLILQHRLLQEAAQKNRGRIARLLADKISIAAKVDFFKGNFIGDSLRKELLKKLR